MSLQVQEKEVSRKAKRAALSSKQSNQGEGPDLLCASDFVSVCLSVRLSFIPT